MKPVFFFLTVSVSASSTLFNMEEEEYSPPSSPVPHQALHRIRMSQLPLKSAETSIIGELHLTEEPAAESVSVEETEDTASPVEKKENQGLVLHARYTIVRK